MNNFASVNFNNLNPTGWGDVDTIAQLLNAGADVNFRINFGWQNPEEEGRGSRFGRMGTPLHRAVLANMFRERKEKDTSGVVKLLLDAGADVNALDNMNSTPLHFAVRFCPADVVETLIKHGAEVNTCNKKGETPLHFVMERSLANETEEKEALAVTSLLLDSGARTHFHNHRGKTPLHIAARRTGKPSILEVLLKHRANTNARDGDGNTPLHFAMEGGVLCGKVTEKKTLSVLKLLLDTNSDIHASLDIDARNKDGRTPLHSAVSWNRYPSILETLIKHGADVNTRDKYERTPLHNVASSIEEPTNELAIFAILIKHGADVNACDKFGRTPLHNAATSINNPDSVVFETLIKHGADVNARDNSGKTPLHLLIAPSDYITGKYTVITGGSMEKGDFRMPDDLKCLVEDGVQILIKHGADVNARDKVGEMPLHIAMREGLSWLEDMLLDAGGLHYGFSWLGRFQSNPREPIPENNWNINRIAKKILGKPRKHVSGVYLVELIADMALKDDNDYLLELIYECGTMEQMLGYEASDEVGEDGFVNDIIYLNVDDAKKKLAKQVEGNLGSWKSNYGY